MGEKGANRRPEHLVHVLSKSILLGCVQCGHFADDSFLCKEVVVLFSHEFSALVRAEALDMETGLCFYLSDEMFEVAKGLVLGLKRVTPHVCGFVTCKHDGKVVTIYGGSLDWTDKVAVDLFDGEVGALRAVLQSIVGLSFRLANQATLT